MSKFAKYDQAYGSLLIVRARVRSLLDQISAEVNLGTPDAINRALAMRGDLSVRLADQYAAQQTYLQALDATSNPQSKHTSSQKNTVRKSITNSAEFGQAYSELISARYKVENKMVYIDDVLSSNTADAVAKAIAMKPQLLDLISKQDTAQATFNKELDALEGNSSAVAMTRKSFDNLSPQQRMAFVRAGGKLRD